MKIILIDDNKHHLVLDGKEARRLIMENDLQVLFTVDDNDKYVLYKHDGFYNKSCPRCAKIIAQRDARR